MTRSTPLLLVLMAACLAILVVLGNWQVERLHWKEALIERVNDRLAAPPVSPVELLTSDDGAAREYAPVRIFGHFVNRIASFELTTHNGRSGWNVFLPFRLAPEFHVAGANMIMVNRGFIPFEAKDEWIFQQSLNQQESEDGFDANVSLEPQTLVGLFRVPLKSKPGRFVNDNDPQSRIYYWRDIETMQATSNAKGTFQNWYLDMGLPGESYPTDRFPVPGTTRVVFPNNHLQYAITWYGLALALLGVGSYFLYQRISRKRSDTQADG